MARAGILFGLAAVVAFIGGLFIPAVGIFVAFLAVIALGWGAGYTAAKTTGAAAGQGTGRGAGAGAIAGLIQLIGIVIAFIALAGVFLSIPGVREQFQQALQQDPSTAGADPTALAGIGLGVAGALCGGINFLLMTIGGLIGGLMWKGTPDRGEYVAAGRAGGGGTGFGTTNSPYDTAGTTGTVSTYDTTPTTGTGFGATGTTTTTGTASTYDAGSTAGTGFGTTGTTGTIGDQGDADGGVRVYDTDDRNRS